jgi:hypothetical protein
MPDGLGIVKMGGTMKTRICFILFYMLAALGAGQENAGQPPEWLQNINPADYVLLASDLHDPFAFSGDIGAEAKSLGTAVTAGRGLERQDVAYLQAGQSIKYIGPGSREDCPAYITLTVFVFETREQAIAFCQEEFKDFNFGELSNPIGFSPFYNGLKDPRLEGVGTSSVSGSRIQYKNMVAAIDDYGCASNIPYDAHAKLAKLWIDKISKSKIPELADLEIQSDWIWFYGRARSADYSNNKLPHEVSADAQSIQVWVKNKGTVEAKNVKVQLYIRKDGADLPLGDPVDAGDIEPGKFKWTSHIWNLEGKNVEDATILAEAFIPGQSDANKMDNAAAATVSIYYAHNGERAFSWYLDTYSFENYDFTGRETEEMVEGLIATVVGNMQGPKESVPLLERLLFPQTFIRFWNYTQESMNASAGGHCWGMDATSALYFQDSSLKPVPKPTKEMSPQEASTNIAVYHRAQMVPLWESLLTNKEYIPVELSPAKCYQAVKDSLKNPREPITIAIFGSGDGHNVLAYKLIEVEGRQPVVYIYDSNCPVKFVKKEFPMPYIQLMPDIVDWKFPEYLHYEWASRGIGAQKVYRKIPLDQLNAIVPDLKKALYELIKQMKNKDQIMVGASCPADALFTDPQGRRTGTLNGVVINEIPGAEALSEGEVEIYLLPADGKYSISVVGTGSGEMGLDIIRPDGENSASLVSFQKISIDSGTEVSGELDKGGAIQMLQSEGDIMQPTLTGSLDLTGFDKAAPKELISTSGKPLYSDDFSDPNSGWLRASNDPDLNSMGYENGRYHILEKKPGHQAWSSPPGSPVFSDFAAEVEATQEDGPNNNGYGFVMRRDTAGNAYNFVISGNGNYRFDKLVGGKWTEILPWTWSSSIKTGRATNNIRVEAAGDKFTFYVNGAKIGEAQDSTILSGRIGLVVGAYDDDPNAHISFDNLRVWALGQG